MGILWCCTKLPGKSFSQKMDDKLQERLLKKDQEFDEKKCRQEIHLECQQIQQRRYGKNKEWREKPNSQCRTIVLTNWIQEQEIPIRKRIAFLYFP